MTRGCVCACFRENGCSKRAPGWLQLALKGWLQTCMQGGNASAPACAAACCCQAEQCMMALVRAPMVLHHAGLGELGRV